MLLRKSTTHNYIVLRPPPGVRFSIWQADVNLEFEIGREREIISFLRKWIDDFIEPMALQFEREHEAKRVAAQYVKPTVIQAVQPIQSKAEIIETETEPEILEDDDPPDCGAMQNGLQCKHILGHPYPHNFKIPVVITESKIEE